MNGRSREVLLLTSSTRKELPETRFYHLRLNEGKSAKFQLLTVQKLIQSCSSLSAVRREHRPPPIDGVHQTRQRPDLCIDQTVLADVVVTTPTCKSYVENKANA